MNQKYKYLEKYLMHSKACFIVFMLLLSEKEKLEREKLSSGC